MVADANRRGYQHLLEGFWDEARGFGLDLPTEKAISAPSFCNARHKIKPQLLRSMLHELASEFYPSEFESQRWRGRRVFAVDGTKINVQRDDDLEREFGVPAGGCCPQVLTSVLLDVCAKAPVDVQVSGFAHCERDHLLSMLPMLDRGDLIVLDRGYPSHKVLHDLSSRGIDFLVRVPSSHSFSAIDQLRERDGTDGRFEIPAPKGSPRARKPLHVRLVRLTAPDGTDSYYMTSLGRSHFTRTQLGELYRMRWEAEEFYKLMKGPYIGQGQFRSKSPEGIRQEIHALILFLAIVRLLMASAARSAGVEPDQISQKGAVLAVAAYLTRLFLREEGPRATQELRALLERAAKIRYKRRPGRSRARLSLKPRPKWGPGGRVGS